MRQWKDQQADLRDAERMAELRNKMTAAERWRSQAETIHFRRPFYEISSRMPTFEPSIDASGIELNIRERQLLWDMLYENVMVRVLGTVLQELDLTACGLTRKHCYHLGPRLGECLSLYRLCLRNNRIGSEGGIAIIKGLQRSAAAQYTRKQEALKLSPSVLEADARAVFMGAFYQDYADAKQLEQNADGSGGEAAGGGIAKSTGGPPKPSKGGALARLRAKQAVTQKKKEEAAKKMVEEQARRDDPVDPRVTAWLGAHARGDPDPLPGLMPMARAAEQARMDKELKKRLRPKKRGAGGEGIEEIEEEAEARRQRKRAAAGRKGRRRSALDDLGADPSIARKAVRRGSVVGRDDGDVRGVGADRGIVTSFNRGSLLSPFEELDLTNCDLLDAVGSGPGGAVFTLMRGAVAQLGRYLEMPECGLRTLILSKNKFSEVAAEPLVRAVAVNTTLQTLEMETSQCGTAVGVALVDVATRRPQAYKGRDGAAGGRGLAPLPPSALHRGDPMQGALGSGMSARGPMQPLQPLASRHPAGSREGGSGSGGEAAGMSAIPIVPWSREGGRDHGRAGDSTGAAYDGAGGFSLSLKGYKGASGAAATPRQRAGDRSFTPKPPLVLEEWQATELPEQAGQLLVQAAEASHRATTPYLRQVISQTAALDEQQERRLREAQRPDRPTGMTALGLKCCYLGDEGASALRPLLMRGGRLRILDLRVNRITAPGLRHVCRGVAVGKLTTLDVSGNKLGSMGAKVLAVCLSSRFCPLETLRCNRCCLTNDGTDPTGASDMATALQHNRTLSRLEMAANTLTPQKFRFMPEKRSQTVVYALARALQDNQTLQHLDLTNNWIQVTGQYRIVDSMKKHPYATPYAGEIADTLRRWVQGMLFLRATGSAIPTTETLEHPAHPLLAKSMRRPVIAGQLLDVGLHPTVAQSLQLQVREAAKPSVSRAQGTDLALTPGQKARRQAMQEVGHTAVYLSGTAEMRPAPGMPPGSGSARHGSGAGTPQGGGSQGKRVLLSPMGSARSRVSRASGSRSGAPTVVTVDEDPGSFFDGDQVSHKGFRVKASRGSRGGRGSTARTRRTGRSSRSAVHHTAVREAETDDPFGRKPAFSLADAIKLASAAPHYEDQPVGLSAKGHGLGGGSGEQGGEQGGSGAGTGPEGGPVVPYLDMKKVRHQIPRIAPRGKAPPNRPLPQPGRKPPGGGTGAPGLEEPSASGNSGATDEEGPARASGDVSSNVGDGDGAAGHSQDQSQGLEGGEQRGPSSGGAQGTPPSKQLPKLQTGPSHGGGPTHTPQGTTPRTDRSDRSMWSTGGDLAAMAEDAHPWTREAQEQAQVKQRARKEALRKKGEAHRRELAGMLREAVGERVTIGPGGARGTGDPDEDVRLALRDVAAGVAPGPGAPVRGGSAADGGDSRPGNRDRAGAGGRDGGRRLALQDGHRGEGGNYEDAGSSGAGTPRGPGEGATSSSYSALVTLSRHRRGVGSAGSDRMGDDEQGGPGGAAHGELVPLSRVPVDESSGLPLAPVDPHDWLRTSVVRSRWATVAPGHSLSSQARLVPAIVRGVLGFLGEPRVVLLEEKRYEIGRLGYADGLPEGVSTDVAVRGSRPAKKSVAAARQGGRKADLGLESGGPSGLGALSAAIGGRY